VDDYIGHFEVTGILLSRSRAREPATIQEGPVAAPKIDWSHPPNRDIARARLIGRLRYNEQRQGVARARRQQVFDRLEAMGWDTWGTCAAIARTLGVHRSTVCRVRQEVLRTLELAVKVLDDRTVAHLLELPLGAPYRPIGLRRIRDV
jgi:hypothetical protein